jgi:hypothetical protein
MSHPLKKTDTNNNNKTAIAYFLSQQSNSSLSESQQMCVMPADMRNLPQKDLIMFGILFIIFSSL